jgi:hypothetical protein
LQQQLLLSCPEIELQPSNANNPSDVITCRTVFLTKVKPSFSFNPPPPPHHSQFLRVSTVNTKNAFPSVHAEMSVGYLWKFKNGCVRFEIFEALLMKNLSFVI